MSHTRAHHWGIALHSLFLFCIALGGVAAGDVTPKADPPMPDMRAERDWAAALRADAQALHDAVHDNHPGVFDQENPGFGTLVTQGLEVARARAEAVNDAAGWWWALHGYVAGFDDGHLQLAMTDQAWALPARWPGFLTHYRGDAQVVAEREDDTAPPLGARLLECDGIQADALAQQRVGAFHGRWFLESQRADLGYMTLLDRGNTFAPPPARCIFQADGERLSVALQWRDIDAGELMARRNRIRQNQAPSFGFARHGQTLWLSMPSFDGNPERAPHRELTALIAELTARSEEAHAMPRIVLDLRGNGGGASLWSREIAKVLWGEAWVDAHARGGSEAVDWRASQGNIASLARTVEAWRSGGQKREYIEWIDAAIAGMRDALSAGEPYWREADDDDGAPADAPAAPEKPLARGRIYVLTDAACASACLDSLDLWLPLGAIQIGRETSADTVYMEVRGEALSSGLANLYLPMKVYRGRSHRGNNVPYRPAHRFDGDMGDDAALRGWIERLDAERVAAKADA